MEATTKRKILIVIASVAGLLLLGALGWFLYFQSKFASYNDLGRQFSMKYPRQWTMVKTPGPGVAVAFVSPKETALDTVQENVNIGIEPVPAEIASLGSFSEKITQQMTVVFKRNIKITENMDVTFSGRKGHRMVFESARRGHLKAVIVWTIKGDQAYIFSFLCSVISYPQYKPLLDEMLNSFRLK